MKKLSINPNTFHKNYHILKKKWEKSSDICIGIGKFSVEQLNDLCLFLLNKKDDEFALDVLSELLENENVTIDICKEVFRKGNIACKVAVCLRNDLDDALKSTCLENDIMEVREHYRQKNNHK